MKLQRLRVYSLIAGGDDWGNENTGSYPAEPTGVLERVLLFPLGAVDSRESTKPGYSNRVITDYTALVPTDKSGASQYVLQETDRVKLADGSTWAVTGHAHPWASPFSAWDPGYEVALKNVG